MPGPYSDAMKEAKSSFIPGWRLLQLAGDHDFKVRMAVVDSDRCPKSVLTLLTRDRTGSVCQMVAGRSDCPPESLTTLAVHRMVAVRVEVGHNPATPKAALLELAKDFDVAVRQAVASNPSTPTEALAGLANCQLSVQLLVAQNEAAGPALLRSMSRSASIAVRQEVATNRATPTEVLAALAEDRAAAASGCK